MVAKQIKWSFSEFQASTLESHAGKDLYTCIATGDDGTSGLLITKYNSAKELAKHADEISLTKSLTALTTTQGMVYGTLAASLVKKSPEDLKAEILAQMS